MKQHCLFLWIVFYLRGATIFGSTSTPDDPVPATNLHWQQICTNGNNSTYLATILHILYTFYLCNNIWYIRIILLCYLNSQHHHMRTIKIIVICFGVNLRTVNYYWVITMLGNFLSFLFYHFNQNSFICVYLENRKWLKQICIIILVIYNEEK